MIVSHRCLQIADRNVCTPDQFHKSREIVFDERLQRARRHRVSGERDRDVAKLRSINWRPLAEGAAACASESKP